LRTGNLRHPLLPVLAEKLALGIQTSGFVNGSIHHVSEVILGLLLNIQYQRIFSSFQKKEKKKYMTNDE
jgi:hypothetical protein